MMDTSHQVAIPIPIAELEEFCHQWGIRELSLFGSIVRDDFTSESDVDVLADFNDDIRYTLADLDVMEKQLEKIFQRPVDLVERKAIEESPNYIRRKIILDSARVVYAE